MKWTTLINFDLRWSVNALDAVKISKQEQDKLFEMLATVLWIGNITFSVLDNENHVILEQNEAAKSVAKLLDCDLHDLGTSLCAREIHARGEVIIQNLTDKQATDARDALAKALYACIFDWLVDKMNKSLDSADCSSTHFISILDIYGFESFETNNFEQLCINYANEKLQQHFNQHLFKIEQEEYTREGINWTKIEFEDNQDCLELLEKRPLGLLALLDEESSFPKATDTTLCMKLDEHLKGNACFKAERQSGFRINHYAGEVAYDTSRFLEKNRDAVHADLLQLLKLCRHELAQSFYTKLSDRLEVQKRTVSAKFKNQLVHLMERLGSTKPHFVRCIKPNSQQLPNLFDEDLVLQQLRWCGVLEVVRISRSGYPTRYAYHYFAERYGFLLGCCSPSNKDSVAACLSLLKKFSIPEEAFQTGATKLYFRAGQIGVLEHLRTRTLKAILRTQTQFRGYQVRTWYRALRRATIHLQALVRARRARLQYKEVKLAHRSSIKIQASLRRMLARKAYKELLAKSSAVTVIQKYARAANSRQQYLHHKQKTGAATVIQRHTRRWLHAKALLNDWKRKRCAAVTLQRIYRGRIAKRKHIQLCTNMIRVQAAVRGWLQRKRLNPVSEVDDCEYVKITETDLDSEPSMLAEVSAPVTMVELQQRLLETQQKLCKKEDENSELQSRLKLYEDRWTEYEGKMNTMEKMWHDKILQLQTNLEAAKRSLANSESITFKGTKQTNSLFQRTPRTAKPMLPSPDEEFEDEGDWWDDTTSIGTEAETPGVHEVPQAQHQQQQQTQEQQSSLNVQRLSAGNRETDAGKSVVDHLTSEFEHRSQVFKDDVVFLLEVKSGEVDTTVGFEPEMELRRLKLRFDSWKKEFKVQIRETKMLLHKLEVGERSKKKWWGRKANH